MGEIETSDILHTLLCLEMQNSDQLFLKNKNNVIFHSENDSKRCLVYLLLNFHVKKFGLENKVFLKIILIINTITHFKYKSDKQKISVV